MQHLQFTAFPCQAIDQRLVRIAIGKAERYGISYRDATILAAAEAHGADIVYPEDFNDGQICGTVRVVNPFGALDSQTGES